ncbi:hypothetical protein [Kribbella italica]|uniref:Lipoprotein n=1 Tax=Kribbella italica TaxID=1540520 RepID=A0A7W9J8J6_9ACTN|nr:hypothetical protein [Kribbella italica]
MRNLRLAAASATAAAGLLLAGCGDDSGAGSSPSPTASSTPTPSAPQAQPITVTRTGGFAGFDDKVVIGTDGVTTVSQRGKQTHKCKLDAAFLTSLHTAVGQVDWAGIGSTKPTIKHPDDMIIAISAGGGIARMEDPRLKPLATPVTQLLTEAAAPGKLCKPV